MSFWPGDWQKRPFNTIFNHCLKIEDRKLSDIFLGARSAFWYCTDWLIFLHLTCRKTDHRKSWWLATHFNYTKGGHKIRPDFEPTTPSLQRTKIHVIKTKKKNSTFKRKMSKILRDFVVTDLVKLVLSVQCGRFLALV